MHRTAMVMALAMTLAGAGQAMAQYAQGQVWEYKTRPAEQGSLLKIQQIEDRGPRGPIYHISIIGLHFAGAPGSGGLGHAPVSKETLDSSVTRLSSSDAEFPDATAGMAQWRAARGGVFTISVAQIVDFIEHAAQRAEAPPQAN